MSSIVAVLGLAGWTGWPIDLTLYIAFGLVSVAAIADVMHVMSGYLFFYQKGQTHQQVMRSVFSKTGLACLLTSVTTSIGVFSLFFINLRVIQTMGLLSGIGVLFAFILTIILLPILLNWFPPRPYRRGNDTKVTFIQMAVQSFLKRIEKLVAVYPKIVILFFHAKFIAAIFPSVALLPKPPGISIPDTLLNLFFIVFGWFPGVKEEDFSFFACKSPDITGISSPLLSRCFAVTCRSLSVSFNISIISFF